LLIRIIKRSQETLVENGNRMKYSVPCAFLAVLLSAHLALAAPITIDFDYSEGAAPDFFLVPSVYRGVGVADDLSPQPFVPSFYDSGVTFVNVEFATSLLSVDGFTVTDAGAAQYGTITLFWDTEIQSATLDFAAPQPDSLMALGVDAGDFSFWEMNVHYDTLRIDVFSETPFSYIRIPAYHSMYLDTVAFDSPPIPEPSTLLLFGSGLIGLGAFRRKFKG